MEVSIGVTGMVAAASLKKLTVKVAVSPLRKIL
jgi:hypothetical protein